MLLHRQEDARAESILGTTESTFYGGGLVDSIDDAGTEASERPFWPGFWRRALRWFALTLVLWLVVAGVLLVNAYRHARSGERALRDTIDLLSGDDLTSVDLALVEARLVEGANSLGDARSSITSPVVRALGPVPILGRQLSSARALVVTSHDLDVALLPVVRSAREARSSPAELDRVAFLAETAEQLADVERQVRAADLGPSEALVGPLADARFEAAEQLADLAERSAEYGAIAAGLSRFFDDSDYLVLGANNAEMRLATGMHLSVGEVSMEDGDFELPGLAPSTSLFPVAGVPTVDPDVEQNWGFLRPSNDYRKLGYSARFDEFTAPQALAMWEATSGRRLDGVVALDPFVLDALLGVVGDVEVDGQSYGSGSALLYLLEGQYSAFEPDARAERQDRLSEIARATVAKLGTEAWDPIDLIEALRPLARGRHLMVFSSDAEQQAAWVALGVDGAVEWNATGVFLLNVGGSKLDPFMEMTVDVEETVIEAERIVTLSVRIRNGAPAEGLPEYTTGPWPSLGLPRAGTYQGRLAFYTPGTTRGVDVGTRVLEIFGRDGPVLLSVTPPIELEPGSSTSMQLEFRVPVEQTELRLVPSARFPAVQWSVVGPAGEPERFADDIARTITLTAVDG